MIGPEDCKTQIQQITKTLEKVFAIAEGKMLRSRLSLEEINRLWCHQHPSYILYFLESCAPLPALVIHYNTQTHKKVEIWMNCRKLKVPRSLVHSNHFLDVFFEQKHSYKREQKSASMPCVYVCMCVSGKRASARRRLEARKYD